MTLTMVSPLVHETPSPPCTLGVVAHTEGTRTVVVLRGEADLATRWVLADVLSQLTGNADGDVVIDLAGLDFIDSGTLGSLVVAHELLERQGRALTVRSPSRLATRVLGFLGVSELIESADAGER